MDRKDRFDSLLLFYSWSHDLDFLYFKAQMLAESAAKPDAVSGVGAAGLFQAMPATFAEVMASDKHGPADRFNPETSIDFGARYMRQLLDMFGQDMPKALAAYNCGMGRVRNLVTAHAGKWAEHLPGETQTYIRRINDLQRGLKANVRAG